MLLYFSSSQFSSLQFMSNYLHELYSVQDCFSFIRLERSRGFLADKVFLSESKKQFTPRQLRVRI